MIREQKAKVIKILQDYPSARDNDNQILSIIWKQDYDELLTKDNSCISFFGFMQALEDGKLTNFESIRRVRQKIQEEMPELRGKNYKKRQEQLEQEVREEVKELSFHERFGEKPHVKAKGELF